MFVCVCVYIWVNVCVWVLFCVCLWRVRALHFTVTDVTADWFAANSNLFCLTFSFRLPLPRSIFFSLFQPTLPHFPQQSLLAEWWCRPVFKSLSWNLYSYSTLYLFLLQFLHSCLSFWVVLHWYGIVVMVHYNILFPFTNRPRGMSHNFWKTCHSDSKTQP